MEKAKKKSVFETPLLSTKIKSAKVSLFPETALGYLLGPMLAMLANGVVNTYVLQYWDKVLGLGTWAPIFETLLPVISAIVIVIGNLFVGRLMERKPSVAGKARPLILLGLPLIAVALLALFLVPFPNGATAETPNILSLVFVAVGYNLYYAIAWPFYYTSHSALVSLSTRDGGKRSLLATAANGAQLGAAGLAGMVGPFLVDAIGLLPKNTDMLTNEAERIECNGKWTILMIVMIASLVLGCLLEYFFTRERITEEKFNNLERADAAAEEKEVKKIPMKEQIKICTKDKYWWLIILFYFFYQLGGMLKNNDASWFSQAFLGNNQIALAGLISTVGAIPTALGMVIVWPLAAKFRKAGAIRLGALFAVVTGSLGFLVLIPAIGGNVGGLYGVSIASFCLKALGTGPAMYISMALMADVLDRQEAVHGVRTDGFTMALYGSIMVGMTGIANGIIAGLNAAIPYTVADPVPNQVLNTSLFFGGEVVCYLIIALMFIFMNVEKFNNVAHEAIQRDQKYFTEKEGGTYVDPETKMAMDAERDEQLAYEAEVKELEVTCQKKGLNYEEELAKLNEQKAAAKKAAEEKKAADAAKKAEKEAAKTPEQKAKEAAKAEKIAKEDEEARAILEELRAATGREIPPLDYGKAA